VKSAVAAALLVLAMPARSNPSNGLPSEFRPSLPVLGQGKLVNFLDGDNQALTNAAAHTGFSLALPLLGEHFWGRKGLWTTGLSWMALTVVQESLFHAPRNPGPGYPAEVRADLITRLVPCATLLILDAVRGGGHAAIRQSSPPERPGMPWPIGLEMPKPVSEVGRAAELAMFPTDRGGQAAAPRQADPPAECTPSLLFQGSVACSWDAGRPQGSRQVAAR